MVTSHLKNWKHPVRVGWQDLLKLHKQGDFDSTDLTITSAAESSGLVATVDGLFGIIQDPIMYANREYKLKIIANRDDGYKNSHKIFNVDYNYMRITESNEQMHVE